MTNNLQKVIEPDSLKATTSKKKNKKIKKSRTQGTIKYCKWWWNGEHVKQHIWISDKHCTVSPTAPLTSSKEDFCDVSTWYLEYGSAVSGTQPELKHYMLPSLHIQHLQPPYGAADVEVRLPRYGWWRQWTSGSFPTRLKTNDFSWNDSSLIFFFWRQKIAHLIHQLLQIKALLLH